MSIRTPKSPAAGPLRERIHEVRSIFEEEGFGNVELLEGWDGQDTAELNALLTDEEFEILMDRMGDEER